MDLEADAPLQLHAGQVLARDYRVVRALAAGGMGSVYLVEQLSTGKQRALKVMHPELARDEKSRARFAQEARAAARIKSEHVVEVVAAGVDDETGIPWLAMELLDGEELSLRMRRAVRLPPGEVLEIFRQLGHGLGEAHRQGLVHRDLKPENIFIAVARRREAPFTLKILDFGVAKLAQESAPQVQTDGTRPIGTPRWMAPEQSEERARITPATDVWALGLIAFYLLTGRLYWRAANSGTSNVTALLRELILDPIEPPSLRAAALGAGLPLPRGFDGWFLRCVDRDPEARFPNADEALAALVPILENAPMAPAPPPSQPSLMPIIESGDDATLRSLPAQPAARAPLPPSMLGLAPAAAAEPAADPIDAAQADTPAGQSTSPQTKPGHGTAAAPVRASAPSAAQGSSMPLWPGIAGTAAVLALLAFFALRSTPPAPQAALAPPPIAPPAPAPAKPALAAPASFTYVIESIPSGAAVFEGDKDLGETPLQLTMDNPTLRAQPRHFRVVKEGYQPYSVIQGPSFETVKLIAPLNQVEKPADEPKPTKPKRRETEAPDDAPELRLQR